MFIASKSFQKGGLMIISEKRASLNQKNASNLIFLQHNTERIEKFVGKKIGIE